jgi:hypothetical protein
MHFPWKLHELLEEKGKGHSSVVSWLPDGKAFKVHKKEVFCDELMPVFFNSSKYKTFQRSLNLWGFKSVVRGTDKGACYQHKFFVRGNADLCKNMTHVKIKGGRTPRVSSSSEPKTATSVPQESSIATKPPKPSQLSAAAAPSRKISIKPVAPFIPSSSDFIRSTVSSHGSSNTETLSNQVAALMQRRLAAAHMTDPRSLPATYNDNALSFMSGAYTGYPSSCFGMQHTSSLGLIASRDRFLLAINTAAAALDAIRQEEDAILRQAHV